MQKCVENYASAEPVMRANVSNAVRVAMRGTLPGATLLGVLLLGVSISLVGSVSLGAPAALALQLTQPDQQTPASPGATNLAPANPTAAAKVKLEQWQALLDTSTKALDRIAESRGSIPIMRPELVEIRTGGLALATELTPRLEQLRAQIDQLGPVPKEAEPPEIQAIAASRASLTAAFSEVDGLIRGAQLASSQAGDLISRLETMRRSRFTTELLEHTPSPLLPEVWAEVVTQQQEIVTTMSVLSRSWLARAEPTGRLGILFALALVLFTVTRVLCRRIVRWRDQGGATEQAFLNRADSALQTTIARVLPWWAALLTLYLGLGYLDLLPPTSAPIIVTALSGIAIVALVRALSKSIIAPHRPQWRLIPLANSVAPRIHLLVTAMAVVYAINTMVRSVNAATFAQIQVIIAKDFFLSLVFAALFAALLYQPWRPMEDGEKSPPRLWPVWLKLPAWLLVMAIVVASALGYVALGRFLANQVIVSGSILVTAWLIHLGIRELANTFLTKGRRGSRLMQDVIGANAVQTRLISFVVMVLLNVLLILVALPVLLLQWGFSIDRIMGWLEAAFFGFQVGSINISFAKILIGVSLFASVLFAVRMIQRWLDENVLTPPRVDSGLANSIRTGVGYLGFALAAIVGVSYAGLDFTNLAIVAGALSVGIGFGLQSIVNNFVSGLILLVERPIQVGDWVVAGDAEGYVRRISVRSTEIETFDRSSIIVPNSELIAGRVTNYTHRNKMGRVVVKVGVGYGSDPEEVMRLLTEIGNQHPLGLVWPQPFVVFEDFGASSLDFSLRVYIADVNNLVIVRTDLRLAILKTFRERGIEIPFPQQDIHLRDLDGVKQALERARARNEAARADEGGENNSPSMEGSADHSEGEAASPRQGGESEPDTEPEEPADDGKKSRREWKNEIGPLNEDD